MLQELTGDTGASHNIPSRLHRRTSLRPRRFPIPSSTPPSTLLTAPWAFAEAYKQASASQKFAAGNQQAANTLSSANLTLDEACRILNVAPPRGGQGNLEKTHEQFKRLFDMNDPKKGGSFYLQSKVLRARERIEVEVRTRSEESEREEELRRGWRPKVYRD